MKYEIRLSEMEFYAYHGCYDLEQQVGNRFCVELSLTTELGDVAAEDCVEKAVNYLDVYQTIARQMKIKQRTIERVAMNIIEALKSEFTAIEKVRCTVTKLAPPLGGKIGKVSVTLEA